MGRWAQRRRRASASDSPAAPPPPDPRTVDVVVWDGGSGFYSVVFSDTITYDGSGSLGNFTIDSEAPDTVAQVGPAALNLTFPTVTGSGTSWAVAGQPSQISEPIVFPESGISG